MQFLLRNSLGNERKFRETNFHEIECFQMERHAQCAYHQRQYALSSIGVWNFFIQKNSKQSIKI